MFEKSKLYKAIIADDAEDIRRLVALKGPQILHKSLPVTVRGFYVEKDNPKAWWLHDTLRRPTALSLAIAVSSEETIDLLIELGASVEARVNYYLVNSVFLAAAMGQLSLLKTWMQRYPDAARSMNKDNDTLLHVAAAYGRTDVTRYLLTQGFYTNKRNTLGETPFHLAQLCGDDKSYGMLMAASYGHLPPADEPVPPAPEAVPEPVTPAVVWECLDTARIARVTSADAIGYRLTDVFNFQTREVLRLSHNLATGNESAVVTPFADFGEVAVLNEAAHKLGSTALPAPAPRVVIRKRD